jgi:subtilisin family serine protease
MKLGWEKITVLALISSLVGCGGSSDTASCSETGPYACQTGATEPLYTYQWALKSATSFFTSYTGVSDGTTDLNVEAVHAQGIKGQGVNVLVLDDGVDINHEDLKANVNTSMTWNFQNNNTDSTPTEINNAHGTHVAGMIAAAQNGIGVMGIAPRVTLGAAGNMESVNALESILAFGGSPWSINAHVINFSLGSNPVDPPGYDEVGRHPYANLRNGKGIVIVQSAGNDYIKVETRDCPKVGGTVQIVSCENPVHDANMLNPMRIVAAAANAMGYRSSYSSAGSSVWVTGLGGEFSSGNYGEAGATSSVPGTAFPDGPTIYSTDISGCTSGYARNLPNQWASTQFLLGGSAINADKNIDCNYSHMNGTSSSAPTITGVVALMLSANPNLTWRDVRHILATTSRQIDSGYGSAYQRNEQINLAGYTFTGSTSSALTDGASTARLDYGWQTNAAGYKYSNWYGFGLPNAAAAVAAAQATTVYKPAPFTLPSFTLDTALTTRTVHYGKVTKLGQFTVSGTDRVDAIQVRLKSDAAGLCIGSVGVYVKSPSGVVSVLSVPYNIYYKTDKKIDEEGKYGLTSYAFYGEAAAGIWEVYAVSGTPQTACTTDTTGVASVEYRIIASP